MAFAHYVISHRQSGWYVTFEGKRFGPCPRGEAGAFIEATQAAHQAGKDGHDAKVMLSGADGTLTTMWTFGKDSYPSRWAEESRATAFPPRRAVKAAVLSPEKAGTPVVEAALTAVPG